MTDYTDIPEVNALYAEDQLIARAIAILDAGGTLSEMTISPAPPAEGEVPVPPASVNVPSADPALLADVRAWLVQRQADLDAQLAALGIVNSPARTR